MTGEQLEQAILDGLGLRERNAAAAKALVAGVLAAVGSGMALGEATVRGVERGLASYRANATTYKAGAGRLGGGPPSAGKSHTNWLAWEKKALRGQRLVDHRKLEPPSRPRLAPGDPGPPPAPPQDYGTWYYWAINENKQVARYNGDPYTDPQSIGYTYWHTDPYGVTPPSDDVSGAWQWGDNGSAPFQAP